MSGWIDTTSYSRGEERIPRAWTFGSGVFRVVVLKNYLFAPGRWVMHFYAGSIDTYDLMADSEPVEKAQAAALDVATRSLEQALEMLRGSQPSAHTK